MMNSHLPDDMLFEDLAERTTAYEDSAPSRLKSRIYSRLMLEEAEAGPLHSLSRCARDGRRLCVFEELVRIAPLGESARQRNVCRVCHARVLAEKMENAPIYWPNCPYVRFQNR